MPFFSFVLPVKNSGSTLSDTLHSIFSQSYRDYEVLFLDNGSTDNTYEVVSNFVDPRLTVLDVRGLSLSNALNVGIEKKLTSNTIVITFFLISIIIVGFIILNEIIEVVLGSPIIS